MTYEYRAIVTDEMPGVKTVVVRTWLNKSGEEMKDERAFLLPEGTKLTEDNPLDLIFASVGYTKEKITEEKKPAPKKRMVKKEENADGIL